MTKKELEILKETDRTDGSSYRTDPRLRNVAQIFEKQEKELVVFNSHGLKFQKAYYEEF